MELTEKLLILGESGKYDVSCASSGTERGSVKGARGSIGNTAAGGICHTFTSDGRCISLLKIMLTNYCIYDCAYCVNRRSNDVKRASLTPLELSDLTINFYKRNYIEGLFLSSGVIKNPDYTMELMVQAIYKLRFEHKFNGYIHVKAIPGASDVLIKKAGAIADRISVNMEMAYESSLKLLAPDKNASDISKPMAVIRHGIEEYKHEGGRAFAPAGQSTQLIVGATQESDRAIIRLSEKLYTGMKLKRVYYSSYVHVNETANLPVKKDSPLIREHRLYQADWLLRFYGFKADEILDEADPFLNPAFDPKTAWALRNLDKYPVEVNTADYETLLRVPGLGVRCAQRIIKARKFSALNPESLKKLGVVLKRAKYFLTASGKYAAGPFFPKKSISRMLLEPPKIKPAQMRLFNEPAQKHLTNEPLVAAITGEL